MKNFTLFSLIFINLSIFGQPIFNYSDLLTSGTFSGNSYSGNLSGFTLGSAGANQVWNYANISNTLQGSSSATFVTSAPFMTNFPDANLFIKSTSGANNIFAYYKSTTSKLEIIALSNETILLVDFSPNPQTIFQFPFTFGSVINDTYSTIADPNANNPFTITYDAYGSLTTPFGTFDVIRTKKLDGLYPSYSWLNIATNTSVMSAIYAANGLVDLSFFQPNNLSTTQNQLNEKPVIYPNPTNGNFTIKNIDFSNNDNFVNVYDVLGNVILSNQKINFDSENINLSNVASGLYFIKIIDSKNQILFTEKILKQ